MALGHNEPMAEDLDVFNMLALSDLDLQNPSTIVP